MKFQDFFKRLLGSLLKASGFITIIIGIAIIILTGGFGLFLGLIVIVVGIVVYFIDSLTHRVNKLYYNILQIALSIIYLLCVGWYYMVWQKNTTITFQDSTNSTAIVFGIEGYPELPKTRFWTKELFLSPNNVLITSTKEEEMPTWVRYNLSDGTKVKDGFISWNPNFIYRCIINKKIIKAWIFTVNNGADLSVQKKITEISNQIDIGKLNTIYKTSDDLLVKGQDGPYINLQGDKLSFLPDAVGDLKISTIYLAENNFETIPPQLYRIKNLQRIYISRNPIKELPADLYKLKSLKSLLVSSTLIKDIKIDLSKLDSLEDFDISSNKLTKLPEQIKNIPHLKWLSIEGNEFTDLSFIDSRLKNLETLQIYSNKLKSISSNIRDLTKLKELLIFDNQIDSIPDNISALSNLEKLEIWHNPIKYISPQIRKLTKLNKLIIDDNHLTKKDKLQLVQWLPKCKIDFQTR